MQLNRFCTVSYQDFRPPPHTHTHILSLPHVPLVHFTTKHLCLKPLASSFHPSMVLIVLMTSIKRQLPKGRVAQAIIVFTTRLSTPEWSEHLFHRGKMTRCRDEDVSTERLRVLGEDAHTSKPRRARCCGLKFHTYMKLGGRIQGKQRSVGKIG